MQYTYDCAGGRSRLVWTNSHLSVVTTYAYGAEGLIWSRANGEYQVYHYDYRGSVIAVTDIDGNITDTLKYDAYGKVSERTGNSSLIFGYNGRYGVLTDPSGLLYMRTRYYSPDFKRFMSADIIDGSITDSTTLNVFAYVNGNPISFVDPFGLSAERGQNATEIVTYDRDAAVKYAKEWAGEQNYSNIFFDYLFSKRNPDFYNYRTNCANFVSQCLLNGGIVMVPEWHSTKLSKLLEHPINYGVDFRSLLPIIGNNYLYDWDISDAWRKAQPQFDYFSDPNNGYINGDVISVNSANQISDVINSYNIRKGDLLYWSEDDGESVHHATMISDVVDGKILYTGNTMTRFDHDLGNALGDSTVLIVRINDNIKYSVTQIDPRFDFKIYNIAGAGK